MNQANPSSAPAWKFAFSLCYFQVQIDDDEEDGEEVDDRRRIEQELFEGADEGYFLALDHSYVLD